MSRWRAARYVTVALLALGAMTSEAKGIKYAGIHPRTGKPEGGLCFIEFVHVHTSTPFDPALYQQRGDVWIFVGDPVPFGYEGPRYRYYGHHPVTMNLLVTGGEGVLYCYLDGPHWHAYQPPEDYKFVEKDDVHYYAGDYPPEYEKEKPRYVAVNTATRPLVYERPVVVGPPPPEYHGPVVEIGVHLPVPVIGVHVGAPPPVIVQERGKFKNRKFKPFKFERD
ncbi:MAG TPA: hypothetical protein VE782_17565 [Myxococcaceae bacterium]|nr:hypothetical protein [Myxococcaceae bacterium]